MSDPSNSETPEGEFKLLSREIAEAIAESDELKAVAVGVLLGATSAVLAQVLAKAIDSNLARRQWAEVAEILASAAAEDTETRRALPARRTVTPWRDALIFGAASLIDFLPEEEEPFSSRLSCRSRRTRAVGA